MNRVKCDVSKDVVLTCSIGHLNLGDNGLHIYISDYGHALFKTSVFCGFAPAVIKPNAVLLPSD